MDGLSGRIRLTSVMSEDEIFSEIRSVFRVPMANNYQFTFDALRSTGGQNKTLVVPALSSSYKWTASALASKNVKTPIYILAREPLKVCAMRIYNQQLFAMELYYIIRRCFIHAHNYVWVIQKKIVK